MGFSAMRQRFGAVLFAGALIAGAGCNAFDQPPPDDVGFGGTGGSPAFPTATPGRMAPPPLGGVASPGFAGSSPDFGAMEPGSMLDPACPPEPPNSDSLSCDQVGLFCFYGQSCGTVSCTCEPEIDDDAGTDDDDDAGAASPEWRCIQTLC